jgi:hypothetical protein
VVFKYYINLNERGDFNADVRAEDGTSVFEIISLEHMWEMMEDGWMRDKRDLNGLCEYLTYHVNVMTDEDRLVSGN